MTVTLAKKTPVSLAKASDPKPALTVLHTGIKSLDDLALHFRYNSVRYNLGTLPH